MKIKGTKLDDYELVILSGIFARSNMGQGVPAKKDVERWKKNVDWRTKKPAPPSLESVINDFCGKFMESDDHQEMFLKEAKAWMRDLKKKSAEYVAQVWDDLAELYWRDPETYVDNKRWPNG